eukprot:m.229938 g.229938  ORF g.229938 m.229938 type:complete len:249 (-) comp11980_c0_seq1:61-807(-)
MAASRPCLLLALSALLACAHGAFVFNTSDAVIAADSVQLTGNGVTLDLQPPGPSWIVVGGKEEFVAVPGSCGNSSTVFARSITVTGTFDNATTAVKISFTFRESALYTNTSAPQPACNAGYTYLSNVSFVATAPPTQQWVGSITNFTPAWTVGNGSSYLCAGTLSYGNASVYITLVNVRAQAFTGSQAFAPADANSICPSGSSTSSATTTGLVVGGIISGLAVVGIAMFTYSKCRRKSKYEPLGGHGH